MKITLFFVLLLMAEIVAINFPPFSSLTRATTMLKLSGSSIWYQQCNSAADCPFTNGYEMLCQDKICVCGNDTEINPTKNTYVAKLGTYCNVTGHGPVYVKNAVCETNLGNDTPKCHCSSTFYENSYKKCVHGWNSTCQENDDCDITRGLGCSFGVCKCRFPNDQAFNDKSQSCHSKAGGQCVKEEHSKCPETFICTEDKFISVCACPPGSNLTRDVEVEDQKCTLGFKASCSTLQMKCDGSRQLSCIEETCQCQDAFAYDYEVDRCVGLEDARCNATIAGLEQYCMTGTTCQPLFSGSHEGVCSSKQSVFPASAILIAIVLSLVAAAVGTLLAWLVHSKTSLGCNAKNVSPCKPSKYGF